MVDRRSQADMLIDRLAGDPRVSSVGCVVYGGSIAYGLDTPDSDVDLRGFAMPSVEDVLSLRDFGQVEIRSDADAVVYSLAKVLDLLLACNPNVIELLGADPRHVVATSSVYEELVANRSAFVSRRCAATFGGYATQQLRRIENSLSRDDGPAESAMRSMEAAISSFERRFDGFAGGECRVRTDGDGILVDLSVSGIPAGSLRGIAGELDQIVKNAGNLAARNRKKDASKLSKHMSHLVRLLRMGSEMLETGEINTYRADDRDLLAEIKRGKWMSEDACGSRHVDDAFWDLLREEEARFDAARRGTSLPDGPDEAYARDLLVRTHRAVVCGGAAPVGMEGRGREASVGDESERGHT